MTGPGPGFAAVDEQLHTVDPGDWSWSESWFFSWIDLAGGPAGVFRVGVTPNQDRAMLWCFVHVDGEWVTIEESRLAFADLRFGAGVSYDKWGLAFGFEPDEPFQRGRFTFDGIGLVRSGPRAGARVPLRVDLAYDATGEVHGTSLGPDADLTDHPTGRFEQSLRAAGAVVVDGRTHEVRAGAHRDKSWGPRSWRQTFSMGDLQWEDRQLYFVGRSFPGLAMGYLRHGSQALQPITCVDAHLDYDDEGRTLRPSQMTYEITDGSRLDIRLTALAPSIAFDIAHTCPDGEREHWLYWRTLVEARVDGWDAPARGWFEASRYGIA